MQDSPLVSIIIPTLNREHLIGNTLDSILMQTYTNWECIVVDDGSLDATEILIDTFIEKDSRFQYHKRPNKHLSGGNGARNYGFNLSKGDYIQWFDSDDLMMPDKLQDQIQELKMTRKKIHLCSGVKYNSRSNTYTDLKFDFNDGIFRQIALNSSEIMTPSILIERNTYIDSNISFCEKLSRGQETYFLIELMNNVDNAIVYQSNKKLFTYIYHNQSISKSDEIYHSKHALSKAIVFSKIWTLNRKYGYVDVANKMYRKCIKLLFSSLRNKDYKVSHSILKLIRIPLKRNNVMVYLKLVCFYMMLKVFNRPNYKLKNNLMQIKIKP